MKNFNSKVKVASKSHVLKEVGPVEELKKTLVGTASKSTSRKDKTLKA
jgi:hypothetical protein